MVITALSLIHSSYSYTYCGDDRRDSEEEWIGISKEYENLSNPLTSLVFLWE